MRSILSVTVIASLMGCGARSGLGGAEGDTSSATGDGETGGETGAGACEERRVEAVGCDDVKYPGNGEPRTEGVVLVEEHSLYATRQRGIVEFHGERGAVCGDVCACEDEDFVLVLTNAFEGPGIFSFEAAAEDPVVLTKLRTRTYDSVDDVCAYDAEDALLGTVQILSFGESCVAGAFVDLPVPFDELDGAWMAGRCD